MGVNMNGPDYFENLALCTARFEGEACKYWYDYEKALKLFKLDMKKGTTSHLEYKKTCHHIKVIVNTDDNIVAIKCRGTLTGNDTCNCAFPKTTKFLQKKYNITTKYLK